jgi:DNA modification methylase
VSWEVICGDVTTVLRERFGEESMQCCVTSPPYWGLRDYGTEGQIGLESTPDAYVAKMVSVFREVRRVLKDDGTLWLNLGDSYCSIRWGDGTAPPPSNTGNKAALSMTRMSDGLKPKDLVGIPWRVAFALQADGWYLRSDIIWSKPNPMPESVTDRPTKAHEYIFLMSKSERYYYDADAIAERSIEGAKRFNGGHNVGADRHDNNRNDGTIITTRNKRSVWEVVSQPYAEAHFATFPRKLIEPCILAGCPVGGFVLDPFAGSGTTLMVAKHLNRRAVGIELNPDYVQLVEMRMRQEVLSLDLESE